MTRMKRIRPFGVLATTVLLLAAAAVSVAAPVDSDGALRAAAAWRGRSVRPLDRPAGAPTGRTRTFSEGGTDLFHLVELSRGGFVAVAADDARASVMAFSPSGELPEEDDGGRTPEHDPRQPRRGLPRDARHHGSRLQRPGRGPHDPRGRLRIRGRNALVPPQHGMGRLQRPLVRRPRSRPYCPCSSESASGTSATACFPRCDFRRAELADAVLFQKLQKTSLLRPQMREGHRPHALRSRPRRSRVREFRCNGEHPRGDPRLPRSGR